ncbi:hypothetical protein KY284_027186 [Solanum tuberosum]|nr:hypothetical protein KY284_027186 [Solanum tuberosum]
MVKAQQDERLIQFLMGLSEAYAAIRRNILMISPMPSVSLAYSLLIQDEKQREIFVSSYPAGNHSSYLVANGNGPPQYPGHGNRSQTPEYKTKKGIVGSQSTQEQVSQLVHLLNQVKVIQPDANPVDQSAMATYAGNNSISCLLSFNYKPWILDSGASQHMCCDSNMFHSLETLPQPINVTLPTFTSVKVTHSGIIALLPDLFIHDGPSMKRPLVLGEAKSGLYQLFSSSLKSESPTNKAAN